MRLNQLVNLLARRRSGAWVLGGIAAVLDGVQRVMAASRAPGKEAQAPAIAPVPVTRARNDFFSIRRTQSDLGFTYWVLQGHGIFASFELFDTWAEAIAAAEVRLTRANPELVGGGR